MSIEGTYLNTQKDICDNITANIILTSEKLKPILLKSHEETQPMGGEDLYLCDSGFPEPSASATGFPRRTKRSHNAANQIHVRAAASPPSRGPSPFQRTQSPSKIAKKGRSPAIWNSWTEKPSHWAITEIYFLLGTDPYNLNGNITRCKFCGPFCTWKSNLVNIK